MQLENGIVNGEISNDPLNVIEADDPVLCAIYAKEKNVLDKPSWVRFKSLVKREKKLIGLQNQAKLRRCRTSPKHNFGCDIRRNNY